MCERSTARIKPAIHDKGFTLHGFTGFGDKGEAIDDGTVKVNIVGAFRVLKSCSHRFGHLVLEFLNGAHALHLTAFTSPNGQRCSPVAFTGDGPILDVAQPFTKAPFANPIRGPFDLVVEFQEVVLHRRHANKPGIHGVVEKRMVGAPAVRVVVEVILLSVEQATFWALAVTAFRG